jgi:hypothetical protein
MKHWPIISVLIFLMLGCMGQDLEQVEQQERNTQAQQRNERQEQKLDNLRDEVERLHRIQEDFITDIRFLFLLTISLHEEQDNRLESVEQQILAVHECAQIRDFAERAIQICSEQNELYYCRIEQLYQAKCLMSQDGTTLIAPTQPGVVRTISNRARQETGN